MEISYQGEVYATVAHNGNLLNAHLLRQELENEGKVFTATSDTEVIARLIEGEMAKRDDFEKALLASVEKLQGAFSLGVLTKEEKLYAVRDPYGFRPLSVGYFDGSWVLASETTAFHPLQAKLFFHVKRGSVVELSFNKARLVARFSLEGSRPALCIFELIYLALPTSILGNDEESFDVVNYRRKVGEILAKERLLEADLVTAMPKTARTVAQAYANKLGLEYWDIFSDHTWAHRIFILPSDRVKGVDRKNIPLKSIFEGKSIILVDDSIVRGDTMRRKIAELKALGVKKIHLLIASSPYRYGCHYGVDTSSHGQLIAERCKDVEEIRQEIGADSLYYISLEGSVEAAGVPKEHLCTACFDGDYPIPIPPDLDKEVFERP